MPFNTFKSFIFVLSLTVYFIACAAPEALQSVSEIGGFDAAQSYKTPLQGKISELSISDSSSLINLKANAEEEDALIIIYSFEDQKEQKTFQLTNKNLNSQYLALAPQHFQQETNVTDSNVLDFTESLHGYLREQESKIDLNEDLPNLYLNKYLTGNVSLGTKREFKIINSFMGSSFETISTSLKYQNQFVEFYVDERDENQFTNSELDKMGDDFSRYIPVERAIFGDESDINGDDKIVIVLSRVVNNLGKNKGGFVTGFFHAMDLFDAKKYVYSNEMEIIYACVPDPQGEQGVPLSKSFTLNNILPAVLLHEYQHMINFNQHYFVNESVVENGWLNEGLSHLAEDFMTMDSETKIASYSPENPARVADYLANISNICFTCGTSLAQRGGAYLFVKYLYEQAELGMYNGVSDGIELLSRLVQTDKTGKANILSAVYGQAVPKSQFKELMGNFALAIYFSDSKLSDDDAYKFFGINLRGALDDNRGTFLMGPAIQDISSFPYTGILNNTGITYLQIPSTLINATQGEINLELGSQTKGLGGYLITSH